MRRVASWLAMPLPPAGRRRRARVVLLSVVLRLMPVQVEYSRGLRRPTPSEPLRVAPLLTWARPVALAARPREVLILLRVVLWPN